MDETCGLNSADPALRQHAIYEQACHDRAEGRLEQARQAFAQLALSSAFADERCLAALADLLQQTGTSEDLGRLYRRAAFAALERGDLDALIRHSLLSAGESVAFTEAIDQELYSAIRSLAAHYRRTTSAAAVGPVAGTTRIGFVLEQFNVGHPPLELLELLSLPTSPNCRVFTYSTLALQREGLAFHQAETKLDQFTQAGFKVCYPDAVLAPTAQIDFLYGQIAADSLQALYCSALDLLPQWAFMLSLNPAPIQVVDERQAYYHAPQVLYSFIEPERSCRSSHRIIAAQSGGPAGALESLLIGIHSLLGETYTPPETPAEGTPAGDTFAAAVSATPLSKSGSSSITAPDPTMLTEQGLALLHKHQDEDALKLLDQVLTLRPEMYALHYAKALALSRLGRAGEAIHSLRTVLIKSPTHQQAADLLLTLQSRSGIDAEIEEHVLVSPPESFGDYRVAAPLFAPIENAVSVENVDLRFDNLELEPLSSAAAGGEEPTLETPSHPDHGSTAGELVNHILLALQQNERSTAYELITAAKASGSAKDLFYLEGLYWIMEGELSQSRSALLRELELYPANEAARELLRELDTGA